MNRNTQERFALNPTNIDIQRSRFLMTPEVKTSFNVSELVPIGMPIEVLPGDTFEISVAAAVRMQPLVSAPLDNLEFSYYFFFVPNRLVFDKWKAFMGENEDGAWIQSHEYRIPMIRQKGGFVPHSVADYMGLPIADPNTIPSNNYLTVSALPFRGYALCYQEWFRNQNIIPPPFIDFGESWRDGKLSTDSDYNDPLMSAAYGGHLFKVSKHPDYFVKGLPGPQKGTDLTIMDHMPVYFDSDRIMDPAVVFETHPPQGSAMAFYNASSQPESHGTIWSLNGASTQRNVQPQNWYVDGNLTISALRTAFQIQKLYEKDARGGTRYRELLISHFGVTSPDASQQVPQYLGGKTIPINVNSVVQTSESGETPQGNIAGYSLTSFGSRNSDFIQSFTEHGYLFCLGAARINQHSYQQGIHRSWTRMNRTQFYFPVLANISEQPILNKEIYATGTALEDYADPNADDNKVFAYQEAWAEYRYMPSAITGQMRSNVTGSLDSWHFADFYNTRPSLSKEWIEEDENNVNRVLTVQSNVSDQLFGDFRFNIKATRPMPMYSIPGLVDHH